MRLGPLGTAANIGLLYPLRMAMIVEQSVEW
jgi:hypothetical protein